MTGEDIGTPRKFFEYLDELLGRLKKTIIFFIVFFFLIFLTGPGKFNFFGVNIILPFPNFFNSFSVLLLKQIEYALVPKGMILINVAPFDIVVSDVYVALSISLSLTIPLLVYQILSFASPGLYAKERKVVIYSILPIFILFAAGVIFALKEIIPLLLKLIYEFSINLHVLPTMGIKDFISIILLICVGMGAVFETPVIIITLSYLRIVKPSFWFKNWRYAIIGAFFVALLISPGATGGIMEVTIATIIIILYFMGALIARKVYKDN
jgi:sec-independent protein translocase protein TatC